MKIPKSLKLPRKLKKELKKGFTHNYKNIGPFFDNDLCKVSMHTKVTYSGSNTKSYHRLCKFARKEELQTIQNLYNLYNDVHKPWNMPENIDLNFFNINVGAFKPDIPYDMGKPYDRLPKVLSPYSPIAFNEDIIKQNPMILQSQGIYLRDADIHINLSLLELHSLQCLQCLQ